MTAELINQIAFILLGLAILLVAGDILVRGAVSLAAALRIPALLVSLTIVAFGTSAPEMVVTIQAVLDGADGIALGNIIGSNIANIFLVLGLPALIYPISTHVPGLRRHAVFMLAATVLFLAAAYIAGFIDTKIGAALFAGIVLYVAYMGMRASRGADDNPVLDEVEEYRVGVKVGLKIIAFLIIGLIGLPLGAHLLVENSAALASDLGVREEVIGLTIIAFGTSLPEMATVLAAAFHKKSDVAIGGVVGSNIFNIFAVGGAAGLAGTAVFDPASLRLDLPVMAIAAVMLSFFVLTRRDIGRLTGFFFVLAYAGFLLLLAKNAGAF
ncbi:MAG: calcium/sodium antiporter [Parvularculaceae bacterium]